MGRDDSRRVISGGNKKMLSYFGITYNRIYNDFVDKGVYKKEYREIIARLSKARAESGLTQSEVAKKLKKPQSYVSKIESGERRLDVAEIKKFAEIYKKDVGLFIN